jgi:uncharacterized iron-regulated membrane protein
MSLDSVAAIGTQEGMRPGYTISFPKNATDDNGGLVFGSFTLSNSWPRPTGQIQNLTLDQFTGNTLGDQGAEAMGNVSRGMDTLVMVHMGVQLGLIDRIFMTVLCVLAIWSSVSALVMFTKRRRPGSLGLPRRPVDLRLGRKIKVAGTVLGVMFPQWAATALLILGFDRFVIRRVPRLRMAFGQR